MIKYALNEDGSVNDRENGACGIRPGIWMWEHYQEWLAAGNAPVPVKPGANYVLDGDVWVLPLANEKHRLQQKVNTTCEAHILAKYSVYDQLNILAGHYGEATKGAYSLFTLNCRVESNRVWDLIEAATTTKEAEDAFATLNLPTE